ncbi:MAG: YlxR family protein [Tissierellia bacterium]|nr:YlxR family protein [Tissierellia bacterium]
MKKRKIPLRKCVACNENKPKNELIRIVKDKEGNIEVDLTGKMNGRGAYICPDDECFIKAKQSKILEKTLKTHISDEIYENIKKTITDSTEY